MNVFYVMHQPPNYSEADRAARDDITDKLLLLHREYQDLCAPLVKLLTEMDARYAPRPVMILKPLEEGSRDG